MIKTISGHLTATEKNAIKQMLHLNIPCGKTPKKEYYLSKEGDIYTVRISQNDRGLIPCAGSELRKSTSTSTFKIIL